MTTKYLKMSDPGRSFFDPANGLDLCTNQVKPCDNFTPMTQDFLRNGGIIEVTEEEFMETATAPDLESSSQEPSEEGKLVEEAPPEESPSEEGGLDALLNAPVAKKSSKK
jgi:hypothetical protein